MTTGLSAGQTPVVATQEILTLVEAAAYLRVSEDLLREMATAQEIPARKIGDEWRFLKSALQDWLRRDPAPDERWLAWARSWPPFPPFDLLAAEVERRLLAKLAPDLSRPQRGSKERVLQLAGVWKDDPTLDELLAKIYKQRGRPMTEEGP